MFHALCHHKIKFSRANRRLAILLRSCELHALELPSLIQEKLLLISENNSSTDIISSAHPIAFASRLLSRCCSTFREHAIDFRIFLMSPKRVTSGTGEHPIFRYCRSQVDRTISAVCRCFVLLVDSPPEREVVTSIS